MAADRGFINYNLASIDYRISICIKTAVNDWSSAHKWGDFHFALSLRKSLLKRGYNVSIALKNEEISNEHQVVIVLRGLESDYSKHENQLLLMWNISHPSQISTEEYNCFDHVFVASKLYAEQLKDKIKPDVDILLQCTDPDLFKPVNPDFEHEVLFIGNSRNELRKVVAYAIDAGVNLSVYGSNWNKFIDQQHIKGEYISNEILHQMYSSTKILLNDHWDDMRLNGFLSNRLFDALACNTLVLSDYVEGINTIFSNQVVTYSSQSDFINKINLIFERSYSGVVNFREEIVKFHTFDQRADTIDKVIQSKI